jgi:hypothetical protein
MLFCQRCSVINIYKKVIASVSEVLSTVCAFVADFSLLYIAVNAAIMIQLQKS